MEALENLSLKVAALEGAQPKRQSEDAPEKPSAKATEATDDFACSMTVRAVAAGFCDTKFVRCAEDYYSWALEARREHLSAPSTEHLCKSIVMCNTKHPAESSTDPLNSKYYCVVVQYHRKLKAEDLARVLKRLNAEAGREVSTKAFHFRLADDCVGVTGYEPNAVTPLGLRTPMPIVLDKEILKLQPPSFWMGGGEVNLKWNVQIRDFMNAFHPIVGDVTPDV